MDKCREEFEKKLKCQELLSELTFHEETSSYVGDILPSNLATINGAYWAWVKRQTEVDGLQAKVEELQKRVDLANLGINGAMRWVEEDAIDDPDFIKGGVLSALRRLEQALKGEECQ